ncbi:MAG TPA: hypothetical protein VM578_08015 [Candidatus Saccharimonadales bacterium]|nr:hypothetical protein [Candidatus Saccharimonadales bacterium]
MARRVPFISREVYPMLRVEFHDAAGVTFVRMEGRLVGKFAEDTRELILRHDFPSKLVVNLSDVSFVDATGEQALSCFSRIGVRFIAENAYSRNVCERLRLPLAPPLSVAGSYQKPRLR